MICWKPTPSIVRRKRTGFVRKIYISHYFQTGFTTVWPQPRNGAANRCFRSRYGCNDLQRGKENKFYLVYAISRSTNYAENNYHSSKLEMKAIVRAVTCLKNFLINIKFGIVTDVQLLFTWIWNVREIINSFDGKICWVSTVVKFDTEQVRRYAT